MATIQKDLQVTLEKTFDHLLEGCQIIGFDWRYLYVNDTVAKQGHQTKTHLLGHTMMDVYPGIEQTALFEHIRNCMEQRTYSSLENEFTFPDNSKGWFELRIEPVPEGVLIFSLDITNRKKAEMRLQEANLRNENILTNIGEGLIVTDATGKTIVINRAAQEMLQYTTEEFLDKPLVESVKMVDEMGKTIPTNKRPMNLVIENKGTIVNIKNYYVKKDGTTFPVAITVTPLIKNEKLTGTIEVFRDIAKDKDVDKTKAEFVSVASHALRTPLGVSKWYLEALQSDSSFETTSDIIKGYVKEVYKSNERLLDLVRDLLSVSRIDSGKKIDVPTLIDVRTVITNAIKDVSVLLAKNNIQLHKTFQTDEMPQVFVSPAKLQEVIDNLISNAIKYNKLHGKIFIDLVREENVLVLRVTDNGIGISPEDQKQIFAKFFRSEQAIKNNTEGSGLGLYVVKSYVEEWGGKITVTSTPGHGTTFAITIPLSTQNNQKESKEQEVMT